MHRWLDSRGQAVDCLKHWPTELVQVLPIHAPFEGLTYIGAVQPKFQVAGFVDRRFLYEGDPDCQHCHEGELTLTKVSRVMTQKKTACMGAITETSFARFRL